MLAFVGEGAATMTHLLKSVRDFAYWRWRRLYLRYQDRLRHYRGWRENLKFERDGPREIDPRIVFPSYMSLDEHVDVERLRSLDDFLCREVSAFLEAGKGELFTTGYNKRNFLSRTAPGSVLIPLSVNRGENYVYLELDDPDKWSPTQHQAQFAHLMEFIETLPFERTARIVIFCDNRGRAVTAHRDHPWINVLHEFVWFRTNLDKPFYVQNARTKQKQLFSSYTAWFDTVNQYHGSDATDKPSISVRVDGRFTEEFRAQIPRPATNPASTPSLWATLSGQAPDRTG